MQQQTLSKLQAMDDFQILRFFNYVNNSLAQEVKDDAETVINTVPDQVKEMSEMQQVLQLQSEYETPLEQKEAAKFARTALELMAQNSETEPAISESLANYKDNEMAVGAILALGGAVSFIVLLSTSKLSYSKKKGWELNLGGNRKPEEIKGVTELVKVLFNVIPDSILKLVKK